MAFPCPNVEDNLDMNLQLIYAAIFFSVFASLIIFYNYRKLKKTVGSVSSSFESAGKEVNRRTLRRIRQMKYLSAVDFTDGVIPPPPPPPDHDNFSDDNYD